MELIQAVADHCIRRALGFAGLAVMLTMLGLSFDLALAFRMGGDLIALTVLALLLAAWRAPRRDMRRSEVWTQLVHLAPDFARQRPRPELQELLRRGWRARLIWHAERIGLLALLFWGLGLALAAFPR